MRTTIRRRMILLIVGPTLGVYLLALGGMMLHLRREARADVEMEMRRLAINLAGRFDSELSELAAVADTTARFMTLGPEVTDDQAYDLLGANVLGHEAIFGAALAYEPEQDAINGPLHCPYVFRSGDGLIRKNIDGSGAYGFTDPGVTWWHGPRAQGRGVWTEPYFDDGAGNVLMVTYAAPWGGDGTRSGVTTVDVKLATLRQTIAPEAVAGLDFVILTPAGHYVYSRDIEQVMGQTVLDFARATGRDDMIEAVGQILLGRAGLAELDGWDSPGRQWVFYAPIESTGWIFVARVAETEALAGVHTRMVTAALTLLGTLVVIIGAIVLVAGRITGPIERLTAAVGRIAGGDLACRIPVRGHDEVAELAGGVNRMAADLADHVQQMLHQRSASRDAVIFAMARLAESRDEDTGKHLERICRYTEILASQVAQDDPKLDDAWVRTVSTTAALHDIGKVGIPDAVLCKPGKLTEDEYRVMKTHTTLGGDTLLDVKRRWEEDAFLVAAVQIALGHHERWDGGGYPYGLSGDDIPLSARIVAIADVYDALTSKRVYKPAMPHDAAVRMIQEGAGSHFDPALVAVFGRVAEAFRRVREVTDPSDPVVG